MLPGLVCLLGAAFVCVTVFLPWYEPDLAEPLAPNSVSGWDATMAARIAVAGAVLCGLAAVAIVLDSRDLAALDAGGIALLSLMALAGSVTSLVAIGARTVWLPDPAAELSRKLGLYLALLAAIAALAGAVVQVTLSTSTPGRPRGR